MGQTSDTLQDLVKLDYGAIEAYDAAIGDLYDRDTRRQLQEFRADHVRHTQNLGQILERMNAKVPTGPDVKHLLTEGKVVIAGPAGDKAILRAIKTNEEKTSKKYQKALEELDLDAVTRDTLLSNLDDEIRHIAWIDARIEDL